MQFEKRLDNLWKQQEFKYNYRLGYNYSLDVRAESGASDTPGDDAEVTSMSNLELVS